MDKFQNKCFFYSWLIALTGLQIISIVLTGAQIVWVFDECELDSTLRQVPLVAFITNILSFVLRIVLSIIKSKSCPCDFRMCGLMFSHWIKIDWAVLTVISFGFLGVSWGESIHYDTVCRLPSGLLSRDVEASFARTRALWSFVSMLLATLIGHLPYLMKHQYDEMNDMSVLDRQQKQQTYRRLSTVNVRELPGESGLGEEMDELVNKKTEYRRKRNFKF